MFADQGGFRKVRSYLRYVRDPSLRCFMSFPSSRVKDPRARATQAITKIATGR